MYKLEEKQIVMQNKYTMLCRQNQLEEIDLEDL